MKASRFWLPVPSNLADMEPEEQIAWIAVLSSIRKEEDGAEPMGRNELRRRTGWGGSRADRFLAEVRAWEAGRNRADTGPTPGQIRADTGPVAGQSAKVESRKLVKTGPVAGRNRADTGPTPGQIRADTGPVDPKSDDSTKGIRASKIRSDHTQITSLSPTPLSTPERESVPEVSQQEARGASRTAGGDSAPPSTGSRRGGPLAALPERLAAALVAAGIEDEAALRTRTDRELRFLSGVGEGGLATIRAVYPATVAGGLDERRRRGAEAILRAGQQNKGGGYHA